MENTLLKYIFSRDNKHFDMRNFFSFFSPSVNLVTTIAFLLSFYSYPFYAFNELRPIDCNFAPYICFWSSFLGRFLYIFINGNAFRVTMFHRCCVKDFGPGDQGGRMWFIPVRLYFGLDPVVR